MDIKQLKKELGFKTKAELNDYIAELFAFKTVGAFENSTARKRYENALCKFYDRIKAEK